MFGLKKIDWKDFLKIILVITVVAAGITGHEAAYGAADSSLKLTVLYTTQIRLDWEDNLNNESGYIIDRKVDSEDFKEIASLPANSTSYTDSSVSIGKVYTYRVRWIDASKMTHIYTAEVSTTTTAVEAPISLKVTPMSSTRIDLTWTYPNSQSYETAIERRVKDGEWELIATVSKDVNSYSDEGLKPNTIYYYRVKAVSGTQVSSRTYPNNNVGIGAHVLMDGPKNLYGYAVTNARISLHWDDCENETMYYVERRADGEDTFTTVGYVAANTTYWSDWGVNANTRYTYRVKAVATANSYAYSDEVAVTSTYLESPVNLKASGISSTEIALSWDDNSGRETGFEIWRREEGSSSWSKIDSVGRNVKSYTDSEVFAGKKYYYRVRASVFQKDIFSAFTNEAAAYAQGLKAPGNLNYTVDSNSQIRLTWTDNSSNETGFIIERKTGMDGAWSVIATLGVGKTSFTHTGLAKNVHYFYRVKAFNSVNNSGAYSEELEVVIGDIPEAPSGFRIEVLSSTEVRLIWTDNSDDELGFEIERRQGSVRTFSKVGETGANAESYLDRGLKPGTRYCYRIRAFNKNGKSKYSREIYVTTRKGEEFADVDSGYWAYGAIQTMVSREIMAVGEEKRFDPEGIVTRGEFAAIIVKAFDLEKATAGAFDDVNPGTEHYKEILILKGLGIVSGDENNRYYPGNPLSRQDMSVIVARTMKALDKPLTGYGESVLNKYYDRDSIDSYALTSMSSLVGEKIINERIRNGRTYLDPKAGITRAETAWVLYNLLRML